MTTPRKTKRQWRPKNNDKFWYINPYGYISSWLWKNYVLDKNFTIFFGVYRTRKEAEAMRKKIKALVREQIGE